MIIVNSCGHDSHHPKPCNIEHKNGLDDYLILLIKETSWIYSGAQKRVLSPNTVLLFPPKTPIHYGCDTVGYNDDWIHFTLSDPSDYAFLQSLQISDASRLTPYDFHKLSAYTQMLSDHFYNTALCRDEILDHLMHAFLYTLRDELNRAAQSNLSSKYYPEFSRLRTRLYNNPSADWQVPQMADSAALSLSYFQHLYKDFFGCSCQQDIINARLAQARFYLSSTDMKIKSLSEFCGYENELHFMRQFKKYVGMTPSEYRKHKSE